MWTLFLNLQPPIAKSSTQTVDHFFLTIGQKDFLVSVISNTAPCVSSRDVTAGATGATAVAPKFSDALTLFQPGGADSALPLQRSHHKFPHGYVSAP